jgi:hypothetical protein
MSHNTDTDTGNKMDTTLQLPKTKVTNNNSRLNGRS